jgi:hypothetical protein
MTTSMKQRWPYIGYGWAPTAEQLGLKLAGSYPTMSFVDRRQMHMLKRLLTPSSSRVSQCTPIISITSASRLLLDYMLFFLTHNVHQVRMRIRWYTD